MQLSSKEGLSETVVKARKRPFMTAVVIVSHFKNVFILLTCHVPKVMFYDCFRALEQSTVHVFSTNCSF